MKKKHINNNQIPSFPPIKEVIEVISESENLWSKLINDDIEKSEKIRNDFDEVTKGKRVLSTKEVNAKKNSFDKFTGLPFSNTVLRDTPITMVDMKTVTSKVPRYIVAPDGYVPNSIVRQNYPTIFTSDPPYKKKKKPKHDNEADFIKKILSKHIVEEKINDVRRKSFHRVAKGRKLKHFEGNSNDIITIQNEVTDHFNFELDMAKIATKDDINIIKPRRKKKLPPIDRSLQKLKSKISAANLLSQDSMASKQLIINDMDSTIDDSEDDIDIDILEKLDKQIEENEKLGILSNEKIHERVLKDRKYRMSEEELNTCLRYLESMYGSKTILYKEIKKCLNKDRSSLEQLETYLQMRKKRLEFLNTVTDPQHIFKYLLNFYENKSELLDCIQDSIMGGDEVNLKQLLSYCGDHYKLREFFSEFVAVKNYAHYILAKVMKTEKNRMVTLEKCLRDGVISESILLNMFMSSEKDAKRFFECIPECNRKEMEAIMEQMELNKFIQIKPSASIPDDVSIITDKPVESYVEYPTPIKKSMHIEKPHTIVLPALPEYNEDTWKVMMSQYITQMIKSIVPQSKTDTDSSPVYIEDIDLLELIKELSFLHVEVMKLLKVYLNNDESSAKKLLEGLISEDNLAYQALIELIGEKEAMQIIKSLRLKQAKVIEKIIETHGDKKNMIEANLLLKSMTHFLPESLSKNINTWLNAGQVTADDIHQALTILVQKSTSTEEEEETKSVEDISDFFFKREERKVRQSIITFNLSKDEEAETTKGPLRRKSVMHNTIEIEYRDIPERETKAEGILTFDGLYSYLGAEESLESDDSKSFFDILKKESKISTIVSSEDEEIKKTEIARNIEYNICQEICNFPWFKSAPSTCYDDVVLKLTKLVIETDNLKEAIEITDTLVNVAERTSDKSVNTLIVHKLISQVVSLLEEDGREQKILFDFLTNQGEELMDVTNNIINKDEEVDISKHLKLNQDKIFKSEGNKTLDAAVKESYLTHLKITKLIEILKKFELEKAEDLEKTIKNKYTERKEILHQLGIEYYVPYEPIKIKPTRRKEELKISKIKTNKPDDTMYWLSTKHIDTDVFWEKATQSLKLRTKFSCESEASNPINRESHRDSEEVISFVSVSHLSSASMTVPIESKEISEIKEDSDLSMAPEVYKRVSSTSILQIKDAITIKPLIKKAVTHKAEYLEEDIFIKDDSSLNFEIEKSHVFPRKGLQKRKPKDPYFDFHTLYGPTAYYLPYINPELQRKSQSHEDSLPKYRLKEKQENIAYENVNKMINGFGKSNSKVTPTFANSSFIRRPSHVPLNDWIKLGIPGMASNMIVGNKSFKINNAKCHFHHLAKMRLHKFGLSAAKVIERCQMVEFIGKANAATKKDIIKTNLKDLSHTLSKKSSSSNSLVKSF